MARINEKHGGARPGAGRKKRADEQDLIRLLDRAWPKAERAAAIRKHAELANQGDVRSFGILMAYAFGKPTEKHEVGGEGGGPVLLKVIYDSDS